MDTAIDRQHACAFAGHRPERLGIPETDVLAWLEKEIRKAAEDGYTKFITGMQRGVDLWAAEAVLKLKAEGKPVRLIAASAFRGMENQWESDWNEYSGGLVQPDRRWWCTASSEMVHGKTGGRFFCPYILVHTTYHSDKQAVDRRMPPCRGLRIPRKKRPLSPLFPKKTQEI